MLLVFEDRHSDSPYVERVWRSHSDGAGTFVSVAASHLEMVVSRVRGTVFLTLRGPETRATRAHCPADGEWLGIRFTMGTYLPNHPTGALIDRQDQQMLDLGGRFWLDNDAWEYPTFENAETFVDRLARRGVIVQDGAVAATVQRDPLRLSRRTAQRHFLNAAGLSQARFRQIERARYATNLLRSGVSALDAVHEAGYFDQAHLTRSVRHFIGQTPAGIARGDEQLSFLYKTPLPAPPMLSSCDRRLSHDHIAIEDHLDRARS